MKRAGVKRILAVALFAILNGAVASSQMKVLVPDGKPVMVDGTFSGNEWNDGVSIDVQDGIRLHFKQSDEYVFVGIQLPENDHEGAWIDLYVSGVSGELYNLHASRKLGERKLEDGAWKQWNRWWTNEGRWSANYGRPDDVMENGRARTMLLKDEGWEYQIRKETFGAGVWKIAFEISVIGKTVQTVTYPSDALTTNVHRWLTLEF